MNGLSWPDAITAFLFRHRMRGAVRFYAVACRRPRIRVATKHGVILQLDPCTEYVDGCIIRRGFYEEEVFDAIRDSLLPGDVFWDVGANLGLHALTVAKLVESTRVYAFEPNPMLARLILDEADANSVSVETVRTALDSENGTADFYICDGNLGRSRLHNWDGGQSHKKIQVATATASRLVAEGRVASPNVVKIDVEGNEARVLRGMGALLSDPSLRAVVFEDSKDDLSESKTILRGAGFDLCRLERLEDTQHDLENYLARRPAAR